MLEPVDAVFISDLHLHPDEPEINARFNAFIDWAALNTRSLYILGDFFHAWPGDDGLDSWSRGVAERLSSLAKNAVSVYYIHGNRDFLLGNQFATYANMQILTEPAVIQFDQPIMLAHGDRYCTNDKKHQWFRRLTRNPYFPKIFLRLPFKFRNKIVHKVREHSQSNKRKTEAQMDIVLDSMLEHMQQRQVNTLVHGHIHKAGLINHEYNNRKYSQYVLSDWDDRPSVLCYKKTIGFEFIYPV
ncbi:UDP-2,3-diacylglucosamine hydrolase [Legionella lansingensis]|uniref:UDP-2,3-diacylglucosamine hydrolase n=1 Tax=Legionella lansingensis TaxID=45067 RepID=A0A0W0VSR9_9GAMM|nr:UDP-2,3-diacylglucosamine diphosphatase [Legionella lansingensis]KTD23087.1 UDP-2,3-diacylglucosamine hydrolase [Legionella lansingensis]SNV51213.1 UDP-2,3-diacylglucosamine hydrolase [Legionella lansingensis]